MDGRFGGSVTHDYKYMSLDTDKRDDYLYGKYVEEVGQQALNLAIVMAWKSLEPKEVQ